VPATLILLIDSGAFPLLVNVTDWDGLVVFTFRLPKVRLVGLKDTTGAGLTPVPPRATLCGLSEALSVRLRLALRLPPVDGVKVTLTLHVPPAASVLGVAGQVLVWAKSPGLVPAMAIPEMDNGPVPLLVRVIDLDVLVVPVV
jgi:hypothetical protein